MSRNTWFKFPRLELIEEADAVIFEKYGWQGRGVLLHVLMILDGREEGVVHFNRQKGRSYQIFHDILEHMVSTGIAQHTHWVSTTTAQVRLSKTLIFQDRDSQNRIDKKRIEPPARPSASPAPGQRQVASPPIAAAEGASPKEKPIKTNVSSEPIQEPKKELRAGLIEVKAEPIYLKVLTEYGVQDQDSLRELWNRTLDSNKVYGAGTILNCTKEYLKKRDKPLMSIQNWLSAPTGWIKWVPRESKGLEPLTDGYVDRYQEDLKTMNFSNVVKMKEAI
jgi:hypothetical protein